MQLLMYSTEDIEDWKKATVYKEGSCSAIQRNGSGKLYKNLIKKSRRDCCNFARVPAAFQSGGSRSCNPTLETPRRSQS